MGNLFCCGNSKNKKQNSITITNNTKVINKLNTNEKSHNQNEDRSSHSVTDVSDNEEQEPTTNDYDGANDGFDDGPDKTGEYTDEVGNDRKKQSNDIDKNTDEDIDKKEAFIHEFQMPKTEKEFDDHFDEGIEKIVV